MECFDKFNPLLKKLFYMYYATLLHYYLQITINQYIIQCRKFFLWCTKITEKCTNLHFAVVHLTPSEKLLRIKSSTYEMKDSAFPVWCTFTQMHHKKISKKIFQNRKPPLRLGFLYPPHPSKVCKVLISSVLHIITTIIMSFVSKRRKNMKNWRNSLIFRQLGPLT